MRDDQLLAILTAIVLSGGSTQSTITGAPNWMAAMHTAQLIMNGAKARVQGGGT